MSGDTDGIISFGTTAGESTATLEEFFGAGLSLNIATLGKQLRIEC
jgi:hypothetical protein